MTHMGVHVLPPTHTFRLGGESTRLSMAVMMMMMAIHQRCKPVTLASALRRHHPDAGVHF